MTGYEDLPEAKAAGGYDDLPEAGNAYADLPTVEDSVRKNLGSHGFSVPRTGDELAAQNFAIEQKFAKANPKQPEIRPMGTVERIGAELRSSRPVEALLGPVGERPMGSDIDKAGLLSTAASIPARAGAFGGRVGKAAMGDIAAGMPKLLDVGEQGARAAGYAVQPASESKQSDGFGGGNLKALANREEQLPVERAMELSKAQDDEEKRFGWQTVAADISLGLAELAPKVALMEAAPTSALKSAAGGAVFGFDKDNKFQAKNAAFGAAFPFATGAASKAADAAIETAVKRGFDWAGTAVGRKAIHIASNQAAMDAIIGIQESPQLAALAQSNPDEFKREVAKIVGSNLAFAIPEAFKRTARVTPPEPQERPAEPTPAPVRPVPEPVAEPAADPVNELVAQIEATAKKPEPAPKVDPTRDLVADLQAAMRGNQLAPETVERGIAEETKDHPEIAAKTPEAIPQIVADELKVDPKAYDLAPEEQAEMQRQLAEELGQEPEPATPASDAPVEQSVQSEVAGTQTLPQPAAPVKKVGRGLRARKIFDKETELGGPDILSWLADNGGMMSRTSAKKFYGAEKWKLNKAEWDGAPPLTRPHHNIIYNESTRETPDRIATRAWEEGVIKEPDVNALWDAVERASKARAGTFKESRRYEAMLKTEQQEHEAWIKATSDGEQRVNSSELKVGDVLDVEGERVEVVAIDPDTGDLTLKDGKKFGVQRLSDGSTVHVERVERAEAEPEEDPFKLSEPESVDEQKARLADASAQAEAKAQRERMQEQSAKPLTGGTGDLGQKDMLGGGDLFSETPKPEASGPKPDAVESWLAKAIDATDLGKGGQLMEGVTGAPLWLTKSAVNGALRIVRAAYKGGKKLAEAIQEGLDWLRSQKIDGYDENEARAWLETAATDGSLAEKRSSEYLPSESEAKAQAEGQEPPRPDRAELDRRRTELEREQNARIAALPDRLKTIWDYATRGLNKLKAMHRTAPNRDIIISGKNAADNIGSIFGRQAANTIRHQLNRAFGAKTQKQLNVRNTLAEDALNVVIEAGEGAKEQLPGGARAQLQEFRDVILSSDNRRSKWARRYLKAIAFAEENWDKLAPVARNYATLTDAQQAAENVNGHRTLYRKNGYVFHKQDINEHAMFPESGGHGSAAGAPAPFKHVRSYPTYAHSIAAGESPVSLSAIDLLQRRLTLGRRLINYSSWFDGLQGMVDPTSQTPVAVLPDIVRRADGSEDVVAPVGYSLQKFGGRELAVHNGYRSLLTALTSDSWMRNAPEKELVMHAAGTTKHLQLLFDSFHLGRLMFWNAVSRVGSPSYSKGLTLLDNTRSELQTMIDRGEIPAEYAKDMMQAKAHIDGLLANGLNVGNVGDNLYTEWVQKMPAVGTFNKWLFEQYQRGAMTEVALNEFNRQQAMHPDMGTEPLYRKAAKAVNIRFGNLNSESWIKSRTGQDLARVLFLAPQWNEALIRAEIGAVKESVTGLVDIAKNPAWAAKQLAHGRLPVDMLAKAVGTAILGQFIANQLINYGTRGVPTWENPEEDPNAKISAWLPDWVGGSAGFFYNPVALPMEISHLLLKNAERAGLDAKWDPAKDPLENLKYNTGNILGAGWDAVRAYASGRLNTLTRPVWTGITKEDRFGRKLRMEDIPGEMAGAAVPAPISGSAVYRMGKQMVTGTHEEAFPGQFQKQLMQSGGIKAENAPDHERRISSLAKEFNREKGIVPGAQYYIGDYVDFTAALRRQNMRDANRALDELLKKRTSRQVYEHYSRWAVAPFTGQKAREGEFKRGLSAEQLSAYDAAREDRKALAKKAITALRSAKQSE